MAYIFDASKGETPESVNFKRLLASRFVSGIGNRGSARNVGEGIGNALASLGSGFAARGWNRDADEAEKAGREASAQRWAGAFDGGNATMENLLQLAGDPWLSDGQRSVASAFMKREMDANDPMHQLDMRYKQAQIDRLQREGTSGPGFRRATPDEAAAYGAAGGQVGPDGRFYPINPPSGMSIESDGQGGFRLAQGPGAGGNKPLTDGQSKDVTYATRAQGALGTLDQYDTYLTNPVDRAYDHDPTGVLRGRQSTQFQQGYNAGLEFLQAILRKDTGAAITKEETAEYGRVYLPQPGDSEKVITQKRIARRRALEALKAGMPSQAILRMESASEVITDQGAPPAPPSDFSEDDILFTMQKHGLSREEVMRRLGR